MSKDAKGKDANAIADALQPSFREYAPRHLTRC
ncbi:hypothetical protein CGLO_03381 [Colletotrichum gloeosporioides Cg-14]|uniref:Uncharacterized protein n=1 Tax=Colletotrichum gloeosporioides (strain Cg-14) TaxID=1237896 RepID=T0KWS3_COLGC|nr:hypothetical protein CGLO_03381 [Colletotrichum gloeosporioides Cg-14]